MTTIESSWENERLKEEIRRLREAMHDILTSSSVARCKRIARKAIEPHIQPPQQDSKP